MAQVIFLKGDISSGFEAYGPYENWEDAFEDHTEAGWGMELIPPSQPAESPQGVEEPSSSQPAESSQGVEEPECLEGICSDFLERLNTVLDNPRT